MSEPPDVSIVISTYNRATIIEAALRRLLEEQECRGVACEVIVVDNNSSDNTREVLREFSRAYPSMRCLTERRQGVSHGRNAGIRAALAPIIAFTDDDIRVAPNWVATIKRLFDASPGVGCIGGPIKPIWEAAPPRWLDSRHWGPISVTDYGAVPFEITAARPRCLLTSNFAMRAQALRQLGGFSPRFPRAQDHELQLRYWLAGGVALYSPALVVHTEVPSARMDKAHHRRWHYVNGQMCARMYLRERCGPDGGLSACSVPRTWFGVSRFLFRQLADAFYQWAQSAAEEEKESETFARELAVRHLVGYIAERRAELGKRGSRRRATHRSGRGRRPRANLTAAAAAAARDSRASLLIPEGAED